MSSSHLSDCQASGICLIYGQFSNVCVQIRFGRCARRGIICYLTNISDDCELASTLETGIENHRNWSSDQFFVSLRELSADCDGTVPDSLFQVQECPLDP